MCNIFNISENFVIVVSIIYLMIVASFCEGMFIFDILSKKWVKIGPNVLYMKWISIFHRCFEWHILNYAFFYVLF